MCASRPVCQETLHPSVRVSVCFSLYTSVSLFFCLSVHLSFSLSVSVGPGNAARGLMAHRGTAPICV